MSLKTLRALVWKDLRLFLGDRRALVVSVLAPIIIATFFGFLFAGEQGTGLASALPILLVDRDGSAIAHNLAESLARDPAFSVKATGLDEARATVRQGKAVAAVVIPQGFAAAAKHAYFTGEQRPDVLLIHDPSRGPEQGMVRGLLTQHLMQAISRELFGEEGWKKLVVQSLAHLRASTDLSPEDAQLLSQTLSKLQDWMARARPRQQAGGATATGGPSLPFEVVGEAATVSPERRYNSYSHSFAGMGVQFVLLASVDAGMAILLERQRGLWKRMRVAPLSRHTLLLARVLSSTLISLFILGCLFAFGALVFQVRVDGSPLGFVLVCVGFALLSATFGLLLATLGRTPAVTRGLALLTVLLLTMLGGAWVPAFVFPRWMQVATLWAPTRWAMDGLEAMLWRGLDLRAALLPTAVLLGFSTLFGLLAVARFRWEEA